MFYFSDILSETRTLLNDQETPHRFGNELLYQMASEAVREIHRLRPDSRLNSDGKLFEFGGLFEYTINDYMDGFSGINGWDRYTYPILYVTQTDSDTVTFYISSADRTADTNAVATVERCDEAGVKTVRAENSSGWSGMVEMLDAPASGTDWDVNADEVELTLENIFRAPLIDYVVARCFDIDSEDQADRQLAQKHYEKFRMGMQ